MNVTVECLDHSAPSVNRSLRRMNALPRGGLDFETLRAARKLAREVSIHGTDVRIWRPVGQDSELVEVWERGRRS